MTPKTAEERYFNFCHSSTRFFRVTGLWDVEEQLSFSFKCMVWPQPLHTLCNPILAMSVMVMEFWAKLVALKINK
jgi:hypothetical protein